MSKQIIFCVSLALALLTMSTQSVMAQTNNTLSIPQCYKPIAVCMHEITKAQCDLAKVKLPLVPENKSLSPAQIVGYTIARTIIVNACAEAGK